ncbi:hypothetical protein FB45DRAFT_903214 [Roridomyces roridus]|uniref:Uncharacterized protein n=1 Tax=Roridomyces roridus TaxID=1738132 RepID=A0AAD7C468_9AGAR|nr:hypothetical protein FB45DRAFT_903214 [Roridomyces roridus]
MDSPEPLPPLPAEIPASQRGSALRHVAILSGILAPIAFVPWLLARRQVTLLRRRVDEMGATVARLKQYPTASVDVESGAATQLRQQLDDFRAQMERNDQTFSGMTVDMIDINEELDRLRNDVARATEQQVSRDEVRTMFGDNLIAVRQDAASFKSAVDEELRQLRGEQEVLPSESFKMADRFQTAETGPSAVDTAELHRLLDEARQTRLIFAAIGTSLGDVATIIQRVELEMGHDGRRSERLRKLALILQEDKETQRNSKGRRG